MVIRRQAHALAANALMVKSAPLRRARGLPCGLQRSGANPEMARKFIRKYLPDEQAVQKNRLLRWLGPILRHPRLWHINRRGIALGLAIGVFMGLLIPIAQIPFSAVLAIILRANLPIAIASTLVTNPFTFAPLYYLAYRIGGALVGNDDPAVTEESLEKQIEGLADWLGYWFEKVAALGRPLVVGLAVIASAGAVLAYFGVTLLWRLQVMWRLRLRRKRRQR
jgi:uncharacterized protein (DUF2062 family)